MKKITFAQSLLEGYYDGDTREQVTQKYAAARAHFSDDSAFSKQIAELEQLDKNTALLTHASEGDIDEVMLDLENGADPTFNQSIAYKQAFIDGHHDVARLLRQWGASNPTVDQRLDNLSESITGKFGFIRHLLEDMEYGEDEQLTDNLFALKGAVMDGDTETVAELRDVIGYMPDDVLRMATLMSNHNMVQFLLDNGVSANSPDGARALAASLSVGNGRIFKMIYNAGGRDAIDKDEFVQKAQDAGMIDIMSLLYA